MKEQEKIVVRHDDLTAMVNAIERMLKSFNLLSSSLAGFMPEYIPEVQIPHIAGQLIGSCFPGIPYYIYTETLQAYSDEKEAAVRKLFLIIPAIPAVIDDSPAVNYIEIRIEDKITGEGPLIEFRFSDLQGETERDKIVEKWEKIPESIRSEFTLLLPSGENRGSLTIILSKKVE
jgi:hypothetical protein